MRPEVLLLLGALAAVRAEVDVEVVYNYHERIGIPKAEKIKAEEEYQIYGRRNSRMVVGSALAQPFLAGLIIKLTDFPSNSTCGASLLNKNRLVTAAHCWDDGCKKVKSLTVVLGSRFLYSGGIRIDTYKVEVHPNYKPFNRFLYDIAMIYLPTDISFNNDVSSIKLPDSFQMSKSFVDEWAVAAGYAKSYGQPIENITRSQMSLQVVQCENSPSDDSKICSRGENGVTVQLGYSGGPLYITNDEQAVLIGVISHINNRNLSVFTRITSYREWIQEKM